MLKRLHGLIAGCSELVEVLLVARRVEKGRLGQGPAALLPELRARGRGCPRRDRDDRRRLQRIIGIVDRSFPNGGNCYRRVLMEIAVDGGAAMEPLYLGLESQGGPGSGHAWLGERPSDGKRYDVELVV